MSNRGGIYDELSGDGRELDFGERLAKQVTASHAGCQTIEVLRSNIARLAEGMLAEARADQMRKDCAAMCEFCANGERWGPAYRVTSGGWFHTRAAGTEHGRWNIRTCKAGPIHELHHQETQERPKR